MSKLFITHVVEICSGSLVAHTKVLNVALQANARGTKAVLNQLTHCCLALSAVNS